MTTRKEWAIGIVGGLALVFGLIYIPPLFGMDPYDYVGPSFIALWFSYAAYRGWERGKARRLKREQEANG